MKPRKGAEGFPETKTDWSWHIDGTINVYRVYYTRGNLPANEDFNPHKESTYFLDDYTVRGQKPTSKNYKFTGWEYNGKTYNQGDKVPASNTDITLEAQWAEKEKVYTVNYEWNGDIPSDLSTPSLPTPNEFTSMESVRNAKDATFIQGYKHTTTDGTYTFSGWTENKGTTDYSGDKIVTPITYKGTWTFEAKPVTNYKVAYKWADDSPKDVDLPAKDDTIYDSPEAVLAAVNKVDTTNFKSTEPKQGIAGTWTFKDWTEYPKPRDIYKRSCDYNHYYLHRFLELHTIRNQDHHRCLEQSGLEVLRIAVRLQHRRNLHCNRKGYACSSRNKFLHSWSSCI